MTALPEPFRLHDDLPTGRLVIDASAGTGKTFSLSGIVVRHIVERRLPTSALLVVTFTRAAAAELRDRTRAALVEAHEVLVARAAPAGSWMERLLHLAPGEAPEELDDRRDRVALAIASFDEATITTIHGFCQLALQQLGLRSGAPIGEELADRTAEVVDDVCRDLVVSRLFRDASALDWGGDVSPSSVLEHLRKAVTAVLGNPGSTLVPQLDLAKPTKKALDEAGVAAWKHRVATWLRLVEIAVAEVRRRQRRAGVMGYDDLIGRMEAAVTDPVHGPSAVAYLSDRYRLVLVDEFQDTDSVQWTVFEKAFTGDLVTVGDPKQAIYRFRGADVNAYLAATAGQPTRRLDTNYRSDADLVEATNWLLDGVDLANEKIVVPRVEPNPEAPLRALQPGAPLSVRRVPRRITADGPADFAAPVARRIVLDDLTEVVLDLLEHHQMQPRADRPSEPVSPSDIAVLVPSHSEAEQVVRALARVGVPAVRTRTGSVFDTPAATEWRLLLAALERPSHAPTVRAAALGLFLHTEPGSIDPLSSGAEQTVALLQQRCAEWAERLARGSLLAWYDRVRSESGVVTSALSAPGGERVLTDLDHIAELLAGELGVGGNSATAVQRALDRLTSESADRSDLEPAMRRIDSDAQAVQVTTLHSSKGLEFPVVLLPFSWNPRQRSKPPIYTDHTAVPPVRSIDIAWDHGWGTDAMSAMARDRLDDHEARADEHRLLYVGLTRAKRRTVVWWAPATSTARSALSRVLFDRDDAGNPGHRLFQIGKNGKPLSDFEKYNPDDAAAARVLATLCERSGGLIDTEVVQPLVHERRWTPPSPDGPLPELAVANPEGRHLTGSVWRRWSFSSITASDDYRWTPGAAVAEAPVEGGLDEPDVDIDAADGRASSSPSTPSAVAMPLADVRGGTDFGSAVHKVFERIDPTSTTLDLDVREAVGATLGRGGIAAPLDAVADGLLASMRTPLGPIAEHRRLVDIPVTDRLTELDFDMPLADLRRRTAVARIGEVLLQTLAADDPQRVYAQRLADGRLGVDIAGFLRGSIDAVLRVHDAEGTPRFVVVDYKTNQLHPRHADQPLGHYHPDALPEAMAHSDYPLQALLYSVAVHRYLRWRLPTYDPDRHLGGIAYLFVRGMVGPSTPVVGDRPYGVFAWRPPTATITALDHLLAGRPVAEEGAA